MTNNKNTGRYIGYARVSTDDQNLDMQFDALKKFGVDKIYHDKMSGTKMDRVGLARAIKVMRGGDVLVVWKLDRLGRSVAGVLEIIGELEKKGILLYSIREKLDQTTAIGKAMMTIALVFAQMERDLISERTSAGIAAYKARGGRMGRKHFVLDYPLRLKRVQEWLEEGLLAKGADDEITAVDAIAGLHEADPDAPIIMRPSSWYNWKNGNKKKDVPPYKGLEPKADKPISKVKIPKTDEGE